MKLRYNDELHAYWLDGNRCRGVTSVAKIPEDLYRLQQWEKRQVAIGLATTPKLLEGVAAHLDERDHLDRLCNQAKEAAGAHDGRDRGTNVHKIAERHDRGLAVVDTPLAMSILADYQEIMEAAGLEIVPELIERIVVYPKQRIAGRFDRIVKTRDGQLVIMDLKGGDRAIDYPHSMAIQLALYANAPLLAGELNARGETEQFEEMPDIDKDTGIIVSLPEDGEPRAVEIDIAAGWKAAQKLCFLTLQWRAKGDLIRPLRIPAPTALRSVPDPVPRWVRPPEGDEVDEDTHEALREAFRQCPAKDQVEVWIKEAVKANRPFATPGGRPSLRRFEIIRAAIAWAPYDADVVRAALGLALGEEVQPTVTLGCAFGTLTIEEAVRLSALSEAHTLTFDDAGTPRVGEPQPAA